jgi:hypothetical protein
MLKPCSGIPYLQLVTAQYLTSHKPTYNSITPIYSILCGNRSEKYFERHNCAIDALISTAEKEQTGAFREKFDDTDEDKDGGS